MDIMKSKAQINLRVISAAAFTSLVAAGVTNPAFAVPPSNDNFENATLVAEPLPFADSISTVEATTAPDDQNCVGNGPTVWYTYTPTQNTQVEGNTFGSEYDTSLSVYTGSQGNLIQINCNDDADGLQSRVIFDAVAGQTYYFMVGAYNSGSGGNLTFTVQQPPPPPLPLTFDYTIDPAGSVTAKTGVATIKGTAVCSQPAFVNIYGQVSQKFGRTLVQGGFGAFFNCNGQTSWTATVNNLNSLAFVGGSLSVVSDGSACTPSGECLGDNASGVVRLRGK